MGKYTIRIESTPGSREVLPWITVIRHGRQSVESQCFTLIGYASEDIADLSGSDLEQARDGLISGMRLMSAFEYIPSEGSQADSFFEKKILAFEQRMNAEYPTLPRLHAVVGIVQATRVLFATSGDMLALQITPTSITNLAEVANDGRLHFDTFRSGNLNQQSLLLFIPKTLGTLLKSDELKNLHSAKSSERKLAYLEHLGENRVTGTEQFHALLLEAKPKLLKKTETTAVSIAQLLATESKTEDLLSPPLWRPIVERLAMSFVTLSTKLKEITKSFSLENRTPRRPQPIPIYKIKEKPVSKSTTDPPQKESLVAFQKIEQPTAPRTLSSSLMHLSAWGKTTFASKTTNIRTSIRIKPSTLLARLRGRFPHSLENAIERFNILPRGSKLLFMFGIFLIFAFTQGILFTVHNRAIVRTETLLKNELGEIRTLIDAASAALIYTDEQQARVHLQEAKTRIADFPKFQARAVSEVSLGNFRRETYIPKTTLEELSASLIPIEEQLRHAIAIDTPTPIDPTAKNIPTLTGEIPTSALFRRRLYALEAPLNQITRHEPKTGGGFSEGKPWVTDGSDLSKMTTLTIDGSIYLTDGKSMVAKFLMGKKTDFSLMPIDPPLTQIRKIWTGEDSDYLYVLDSSSKRLVVFNKKDGLLKVQYQSPAFTDLKDFAIDEKSKLAYLLDNTVIVSIPLSH
ncbi:MAG: hypothetical protein Q7S48_01365 [bacterium]|nr:hypothetical protein [bacterium]